MPRRERIDIDLHANASGVRVGIDNAIGHIGRMQAMFRRALSFSLAGFGFGSLIAAIRGVVERGGNLADMAARLGIGAETLQEWQFAAEQSGASIDDLAMAVKFLSKAMDAASQGSKEAIGNLAEFGIPLADIKNLNVEKALERIAASVKKSSDEGTFGANKFAAAVALLGRSGDRLIPAFKAGFSQASEQAKIFGNILEDSVIARLDAFGDLAKLIATQWKNAFARITAYGLESAAKLTIRFVGFAARIKAEVSAIWSQENPAQRKRAMEYALHRYARDVAGLNIPDDKIRQQIESEIRQEAEAEMEPVRLGLERIWRKLTGQPAAPSLEERIKAKTPDLTKGHLEKIAAGKVAPKLLKELNRLINEAEESLKNANKQEPGIEAEPKPEKVKRATGKVKEERVDELKRMGGYRGPDYEVMAEQRRKSVGRITRQIEAIPRLEAQEKVPLATLQSAPETPATEQRAVARAEPARRVPSAIERMLPEIKISMPDLRARVPLQMARSQVAVAAAGVLQSARQNKTDMLLQKQLSILTRQLEELQRSNRLAEAEE